MLLGDCRTTLREVIVVRKKIMRQGETEIEREGCMLGDSCYIEPKFITKQHF